MKRHSLLLTAPRRLEWVEEELPPLRSEEVLVRTAVGSISVGSELPLYRGDARSGREAEYPRMTGYENIGTVLACGDAVTSVHPGHRDFASYGHRTRGILPEEKVVAVPEDITDGLALLAILSCDVAKGVRKVPRNRRNQCSRPGRERSGSSPSSFSEHTGPGTST